MSQYLFIESQDPFEDKGAEAYLAWHYLSVASKAAQAVTAERQIAGETRSLKSIMFLNTPLFQPRVNRAARLTPVRAEIPTR